MTDHTTRILARIIGPLMAIAGIAVLLRHNTLGGAIAAFVDNEGLTMLAGFFSLLAGLIVLAFHNRWNGPAAIAITLIGWLASVRGAALLLAPALVDTIARQIAASPGAMLAAGVVFTALGAWLSIVGFLTKAKAV